MGGWAFAPGLNLSGVTPGERVGLALHRVCGTALERRYAHAGTDSLERFAVLEAAAERVA
jgi:hypothetical protein